MGSAIVSKEVREMAGDVLALLRGYCERKGYELLGLGSHASSPDDVVYAIEINAPDGAEFVVDLYQFLPLGCRDGQEGC